jgi:hypothetical protein
LWITEVGKTSKEMRCALILWWVGYVLAKNIVHFRQATEFGVEQLKQDVGTDRITFFAAMRQSLDDLDIEYVLSFGPPKCEPSCAQSTSNICKGSQRIVNNEWEHIQLEHYPNAEDPAAIYIRKSLSLNNELSCAEGDISKADTLKGNLYLSVALGCNEDTKCPNFETVEIFPFEITSVDDLNYRTSMIAFDAKATRNLRMENVGLFVEITTEIFDQSGVNFSYPRIVSQDCEPALRVVSMTDCQPNEDNCKQQLYLSPIDNTDSAIDKVNGAVTLELEFGSDESRVISLLHVNVGIDSSNDYGNEERAIDTLLSIFTDAYDAYFAGSNATLVDNDRFCVSLASPRLLPVEIINIQTCSINGSVCMSLFNSSDDMSADSERILTTDSQSMICLTIRKIAEGEQTIEVEYTSSQKRRGLYDNLTITPMIIYCDCPLGYVWDPLCDCCVNSHHDWDWSWGWIWVVALVVAGIVLTYCVIASTGCATTQYAPVKPQPTMVKRQWRE